MCDGQLGRTDISKHRLELFSADASPIHFAPYRPSPKAREFEKKEFEKMFLKVVIEPSQTKRAASIMFAPKKDGFLRFCVFYRNLNAVRKRDV